MPKALFSQYDIYSVLEVQKQTAKGAVREAPESLAQLSDEEVIGRFVEQFRITVPKLEENGTSVSEKEVDVDVSGDPRRMVFDHSRAHYLKGTEITVHIPFQGEAIFFEVQPSTFGLSRPRGDVGSGELLLMYTFPNDMPPPNLRADLDRDLSSIRSYLESLTSSAALFNQELPGHISSSWRERKQQFTHKVSVLQGLGLPVTRQPVQVPPTQSPKNHTSKSKAEPTKPVRKWNVFISHASEDKQAVAKPLADALISRGLSVWYDSYTMTVGDSLRRKIDEGLANSEYGIVILSRAFFGKHWTEQELNGLAAREVRGKKVILPVWHDVSRDEIAAASPILADRIGVPTTLGIDQVVEELVRR